MNNLAKLISEENIEMNLTLEYPTKKDALMYIAAKVAQNQNLKQKEILTGLVKRESQSTTGFGGGIALPHTKIRKLQNPAIFVFRFKEDIEWEALDGLPVKCAIALIMPDEKTSDLHLTILAKFARMLMKQTFCEGLLTAQNSEQILNLLKQVLNEKKEC